MFYIYIQQETSEPRTTEGWLYDAGELCSIEERALFDLDELAAILPTLEYDGRKLVKVTILQAEEEDKVL